MAIQNVNLGIAPSGAGGDTFRSAAAKINENFANNTNAASRQVGVINGNVMEVGAFGLGKDASNISLTISNVDSAKTQLASWYETWAAIHFKNQDFGGLGKPNWSQLLIGRNGSKGVLVRSLYNSITVEYKLHGDHNTTVDSNGFIKKASPIIQLHSDRIELNDEAKEQKITFEKVDIGHYLIKGSSGFSKTGWWIEVPTDSNGNKICAVKYQTLDNSDLEIKTFKKKLNQDGDIVANLDKPIDIPVNSLGDSRWIDIRLNEVKKPIVIRTRRTEKQPKLVQQIKYAPQLTYITKYEDLYDDKGNAVMVGGVNYQKPVSYIQTDANGTPVLSNQPVIDENGQTVFEWVQAVDIEGNPEFEDVPVLDAQGNQIIDEVTHDTE